MQKFVSYADCFLTQYRNLFAALTVEKCIQAILLATIVTNFRNNNIVVIKMSERRVHRHHQSRDMDAVR